MLKGRAFGQRTCFDQGAPNLRVSRRNAVFSRFNKPPLADSSIAVETPKLGSNHDCRQDTCDSPDNPVGCVFAGRELANSNHSFAAVLMDGIAVTLAS